jgi:hypothetical protein
MLNRSRIVDHPIAYRPKFANTAQFHGVTFLSALGIRPKSKRLPALLTPRR